MDPDVLQVFVGISGPRITLDLLDFKFLGQELVNHPSSQRGIGSG